MQKGKKLLAVLLAVCLTALLPVTALAANNGPAPGFKDEESGMVWNYSYLLLVPLDDHFEQKVDGDGEGIVYAAYSNATKGETPRGASYDLATNTLTLTDFKGKYVIEANAMGDDFTIRVVGECEVAYILVWGSGYGGNLTLSGSGHLVVNPTRFFVNGIRFNAESCQPVLRVNTGVTADVYGGDNAVAFSGMEEDASHALFALANGQKPAVNKEGAYYEMGKQVRGYEITDAVKNTEVFFGHRATSNRDPGGIYTADLTKRTWEDPDKPDETFYDIVKYIYSEELGIYAPDWAYMHDNGNDYGDIEIGVDEFADSEFSLVTDGDGDPVNLEGHGFGKYDGLYGDVYHGPSGDYMVAFDYSETPPAENWYTMRDVMGITVVTPVSLSADERSQMQPTTERVEIEGLVNYLTRDKDLHFGGGTAGGDVDGNGVTDARDALLVLKHAVGKGKLTDAQKAIADLNGDSKIDAVDALIILKIAVGKA